MHHLIRLAARTAAAALGLLVAGPAAACGTAATDCAVPGGVYRLALPEGAGPEAPVPGVVYLHGWGASAEAALRRAERTDAVVSRGMAFIVPQGVARAGRTQRDWAVRDGGTHPRDDLEFLDAVLADAAARGVYRDRVLLTGFSRGGSMVWDAACARPGLAAAYAPLAGAFWEPLPDQCAGPVALFHTHGWADRVVPLEGRPIGGGRLMQGDVFSSLAHLRRTLGCTARQPDRTEAGDMPLWRRTWTDCAAGRIELMLHPGGHAAPPGWIETTLEWFEQRLAEARSKG